MGGVGGDAGTIRTGLGAREHQRLLLAEDLSWLLGQQALHVRDTARRLGVQPRLRRGEAGRGEPGTFVGVKMLMDNSQVVRPEPDARRATGGRLTWNRALLDATADSLDGVPTAAATASAGHLILAALQSTAVSPDGINLTYCKALLAQGGRRLAGRIAGGF